MLSVAKHARIYVRNGNSKGANKYLQRQYQQLTAQENLCTCGDGKFYMFPFFRSFQENKLQRKYLKYYFIKKFKALLSKKT